MGAKLLQSYSFKSVTVTGKSAKTYCDVYGNGITIVNQLMLSKEDEICGFTKIYTKFGHNLFVNSFGIKYESLVIIAETTTEILNENNVKLEDIV